MSQRITEREIAKLKCSIVSKLSAERMLKLGAQGAVAVACCEGTNIVLDLLLDLGRMT